MRVSVRELKNHLSQYLHRAEKGQPVIITAHRTPIAKLVPVLKTQDEALQTLFQMENVHWNGNKPKGLKNSPKIPGNTASSYVIQDRR